MNGSVLNFCLMKLSKTVFDKRCDFQSVDRWTLGLALAHNVVLHWNWQTGSILQRVMCTEKCILYPFTYLSLHLLARVGLCVCVCVEWGKENHCR